MVMASASLARAAEIQPQTFAGSAAMSDLFEIQAAKIEVQNGRSEKIKAFVEDMIKDHGQSTEKLNAAAAKDGVALPAALDAGHQKKLDALRALKGVKLDAAYASTQITMHFSAVALFGAYSKNGRAAR